MVEERGPERMSPGMGMGLTEIKVVKNILAGELREGTT
jgi:hypothetical protein